jgi:NAD-dependent dihydropyrimidine dehydrogenase PreA subunit
LRRILDWVVAYLCRWLPRTAPTGLVALGEPDETSPVLVTANFTLTVARVKRALRGRSVWLLVANSGGINVWCAAAGGLLTHHRVVDAVKTSGLAERLSHRRLILPALSAPGVETEAIRKATGFQARFGPVYARDLPDYLDTGGAKTESMRRFDFGFRHRADMFVPMNLPVYLTVALALGIFWPQHLSGFTLLFWGALLFLYLFLDLILGRTGWGQAALCAGLVVIAWAGIDTVVHGDPLAHRGWLLATFGVFLAAGLDLAGIASPRRSDGEIWMDRVGLGGFGRVFTERELGTVTLDREACRGCQRCFDICPVGVFGTLDGEGKTTFRDQGACFACHACVTQCPEDALSLATQLPGPPERAEGPAG